MPRVRNAFALGHADAWDAFGCKRAAEEIRLKIPRREFHGWDAALRSEKRRNEKRADDGGEPPLASAAPDGPVEQLTEVLRALPIPARPACEPAKDRLDRDALWSGPQNLGGGNGFDLNGLESAISPGAI